MSDDFGTVGGAGIDDDDFIKDVFDALKAFGQRFFLVFDDHAKGEFHGITSKKKYILIIYRIWDMWLRWADSRFAKPRNLTKGFNLVCADLLFCALIRGLENLESPLKRF